MIRSSAVAALTALSMCGAFPVGAGEYTTFQLLMVRSTIATGARACGSVALLNLPAGWRDGDAAVVLLTESPRSDALRDPLVAVLLDERAAVLEMVSAPEQRCGIEGAEDSDTSMRVDPLADLFGALLAVTREAGAGMVVAIGYGRGAAVALEAIKEDVAARHLGTHGPRFAAAAALADGPARFALGPQQDAAQQASARIGMLCTALGRTIDGFGVALRAANTEMVENCRSSLGGEAARHHVPSHRQQEALR